MWIVFVRGIEHSSDGVAPSRRAVFAPTKGPAGRLSTGPSGETHTNKAQQRSTDCPADPTDDLGAVPTEDAGSTQQAMSGCSGARPPSNCNGARETPELRQPDNRARESHDRGSAMFRRPRAEVGDDRGRRAPISARPSPSPSPRAARRHASAAPSRPRTTLARATSLTSTYPIRSTTVRFVGDQLPIPGSATDPATGSATVRREVAGSWPTLPEPTVQVRAMIANRHQTRHSLREYLNGEGNAYTAGAATPARAADIQASLCDRSRCADRIGGITAAQDRQGAQPARDATQKRPERQGRSGPDVRPSADTTSRQRFRARSGGWPQCPKGRGTRRRTNDHGHRAERRRGAPECRNAGGPPRPRRRRNQDRRLLAAKGEAPEHPRLFERAARTPATKSKD